MVRRISLPLLSLVIVIIAGLSTVMLSPAPVDALSGGEFQAGRIIDDGIFFSSSGLDVPTIQQFLNAKVPVCDTNGTQPYAGTTRAGYGTSRGYPPPYTCLKDYRQTTVAKSAESGLCNGYGVSNQSAAEIIYGVSQSCGVNPRMLIVLLQKEQALITDDWPWSIQYRSATGYGCPDTAPCDAQYYGFFNQVYSAARQFKNYAQNSGSYNYVANANNQILYHPNAACGSSTVYIQNQATAGLYNYTPYRPNDAALSNLYGTGNSCSSYGNRNFWRYYNDWFGSTLASAWNYDFVSSSIADVWLEPGQQRVGHFITVKNTGTETWYADGSVPTGKAAVRLATRSYAGIPFADPADSRWLNSDNQISMTPTEVQPGENATFVFNLVGPNTMYSNPLTYTFVPVVNGITFMRDIDMQMHFRNVPPHYSLVSASGIPSVINPNDQIAATIVIRNGGTLPWYADGSVPAGKRPMRLATWGYAPSPYADTSDPGWLGRSQIKMNPGIVNPGENATFTFMLKGPLFASNTPLRLVPVLDGITFLQDNILNFNLTTPQPIVNYRGVSATNPPAVMQAGATTDVSLTIKNTGNVVWKNENSGLPNLRLMTRRPSYGASPFYAYSAGKWIAPSQVVYEGLPVGIDGLATFNFKWQAPSQPGTYTQYFSPTLNGFQEMPDNGMAFTVTVTP